MRNTHVDYFQTITKQTRVTIGGVGRAGGRSERIFLSSYPLRAPIKDLVQFFRELANKRWEVGDKTQTNLPARRQQPPRTEGLPGRSPFNSRILHISMAIMTSKNLIFIIVCHLPVDL